MRKDTSKFLPSTNESLGPDSGSVGDELSSLVGECARKDACACHFTRFHSTWENANEKHACGGFDMKVGDIKTDTLVEQLNQLKKEGYYFRGQTDSRYTLNTSIQRAWFEGGCWKCRWNHPDFRRFSTGLLDFMRYKSGLFTCSGDLLHDHEIWAYLQHYECPTPFLDFSEDPFAAMYFATRESVAENGLSIYAIQGESLKNGRMNDVMGLDDYLRNEGEKELNQEKPRLRQCSFSRFTDWGFLDSDFKGHSGKTQYAMPKNGILFLIQKPGNGWCPHLQNERMEKQKGLFAYAPLEREGLEDFVARKRTINKTSRDDMSEGVIYRPIICFDIPKSRESEVRKMAKEHGCSEKSLGLEPCQEKDDVQRGYAAFLDSITENGPVPKNNQKQTT